MKSKQRLLITLGIGIILVLGFFFITEAITKHTGFSISEAKEDNFASCLKEQDISLYINTNKPAETLKKTMLFDYLQYFQITNCAANNNECAKNGVDFSQENINWIINNQKINKDINFDELLEYSGCKLISNN